MSKSASRTNLTCLGRNGAAFAVLLCAAHWPANLAAQSQPALDEKLVEIEPFHRTDAVMYTRIEVGDIRVHCGLMDSQTTVEPVAPFLAGADWLQKMKIFLLNRTNKIIVFASLTLDFVETGNGITIPRWAYSIRLGRIPAVDAYSGRTGEPFPPGANDRPPISFGPGQTLVIRVDDYIDEIREQVENSMPLANVGRIFLVLGPMFFEDGMRWRGGADFAVPDPDHRGRFKALPDDYFPGNKYRNWPPVSPPDLQSDSAAGKSR